MYVAPDHAQAENCIMHAASAVPAQPTFPDPAGGRVVHHPFVPPVARADSHAKVESRAAHTTSKTRPKRNGHRPAPPFRIGLLSDDLNTARVTDKRVNVIVRPHVRQQRPELEVRDHAAATTTRRLRSLRDTSTTARRMRDMNPHILSLHKQTLMIVTCIVIDLASASRNWNIMNNDE